MTIVVLFFHVLIALALIGVVLLQRSEGGALGIGGGAGGGLISSRSAANVLTRATAILAATFMATSIFLAIIAGTGREPASVLDAPAATSEEAPAPAAPSGPAVPRR